MQLLYPERVKKRKPGTVTRLRPSKIGGCPSFSSAKPLDTLDTFRCLNGLPIFAIYIRFVAARGYAVSAGGRLGHEIRQSNGLSTRQGGERHFQQCQRTWTLPIYSIENRGQASRCHAQALLICYIHRDYGTPMATCKTIGCRA